MMPTANSIDRPSRGGMTTPNTMIAAADRHDRKGVPDAPGGADQRRARHAALATDDRRNGDHVVGVGRMPHPEEEAEKQEGQDVQGGSGHCARTKMAIPGRYYAAFRPNANSHMRRDCAAGARPDHLIADIRGLFQALLGAAARCSRVLSV